MCAPENEMSGEEIFVAMIPADLRQRMKSVPPAGREWVAKQFVERGTSAEVKLVDALMNLLPEK